MVFDFAKIVKVEGNMKSGVAQFLLPKCNGLMWKIDGGLCFVLFIIMLLLPKC